VRRTGPGEGDKGGRECSAGRIRDNERELRGKEGRKDGRRGRRKKGEAKKGDGERGKRAELQYSKIGAGGFTVC
jgi:hypothetical protein